MTAPIPEFLKLIASDARVIEFADIRKGDTVGSYERGRFIMGIADTLDPRGYTGEGQWESSEGHPVAHSDELCMLINRPVKPLPTGAGAMIRLTESLPGRTAMLYARGERPDTWYPVGFSGPRQCDADFDDAEWDQAFVTTENPNA